MASRTPWPARPSGTRTRWPLTVPQVLSLASQDRGPFQTWQSAWSDSTTLRSPHPSRCRHHPDRTRSRCRRSLGGGARRRYVVVYMCSIANRGCMNTSARGVPLVWRSVCDTVVPRPHCVEVAISAKDSVIGTEEEIGRYGWKGRGRLRRIVEHALNGTCRGKAVVEVGAGIGPHSLYLVRTVQSNYSFLCKTHQNRTYA